MTALCGPPDITAKVLQLLREILFFFCLQPFIQRNGERVWVFTRKVIGSHIREVDMFDDAASVQYNRALEHVLQLSDIARPRIIHQKPHHRLGSRANLLAGSDRMSMKKLVYQQRNVDLLFPQGDEMEWDYID